LINSKIINNIALTVLPERPLMLTAIPSQITPGMKLEYKVSNSDYPADDGWTLKVRLQSSLETYIFESTPSGADHLLAPDTSSWSTSGTFESISYYEHTDGTRVLNRTEQVTVLEDPFKSKVDYRSNARKCLDAIDAAMLGNASKTHLEYEIAGRRIREMDKTELLKFKNYYQTLVNAEINEQRQRNGKASGNIRKVVFL
jgi:hypothetical protein